MGVWIIALLILLIFLLSCDSKVVDVIKRKLNIGCSASEGFRVRQTELQKDLYGDNAQAHMKGERFMNNSESPNTWERSTAEFEGLDGDMLFGSYAEDLKANVDESIIESHKEYVADTDFLSTMGPSHASARDDFTPPVPFHGLPRAAHYANIGAGNSARTAQSETPEDVENIREHHSGGYLL